jgi:hypothetical protein
MKSSDEPGCGTKRLGGSHSVSERINTMLQGPEIRRLG